MAEGDDEIANACESAPLQVVHDVSDTARFWLKGQSYSLKNMQIMKERLLDIRRFLLVSLFTCLATPGLSMAADGDLKWSFTTGKLVHSSPAIGADGAVYVGSWDKKLYALNPDGSVKWALTTGGALWSSPAVGADGTIYVGSYDKKLYAVNPDGSEKGYSSAGGNVNSLPAIGADETISVEPWDNKLYDTGGSSGSLAESPWPKFRHDNRNTGLAGSPVRKSPLSVSKDVKKFIGKYHEEYGTDAIIPLCGEIERAQKERLEEQTDKESRIGWGPFF